MKCLGVASTSNHRPAVSQPAFLAFPASLLLLSPSTPCLIRHNPHSGTLLGFSLSLPPIIHRPIVVLLFTIFGARALSPPQVSKSFVPPEGRTFELQKCCRTVHQPFTSRQAPGQFYRAVVSLAPPRNFLPRFPLLDLVSGLRTTHFDNHQTSRHQTSCLDQ
jgi:hypothetical protein